MMSQENLDRWNKILADATAVVDAVQHARTCGLEVEFMMTFLEHHETGHYSVAECIAKVKNSTTHLPLGIKDEFLHPGDYNFMLKQSGLLPEQIVESILLADSSL